MPLDLQRDKESWPWIDVRGDVVEVGPGDYRRSEVRFDDIALFGQYFTSSEDESPGTFYVIITRSRIGFVPFDAPRCDKLIAALSQRWAVELPVKDVWKNYNRKRGADARILWPTLYFDQPLFRYDERSHDGLLAKLKRILVGPTWEAPALSPLAYRLLGSSGSSEVRGREAVKE